MSVERERFGKDWMNAGKGESEQGRLYLYNDDVHDFGDVIEALVEVCGHEDLQAEQCTYIVHYNGKCDVKIGPVADLHQMCTGLQEKGLIAKIEKS